MPGGRKRDDRIGGSRRCCLTLWLFAAIASMPSAQPHVQAYQRPGLDSVRNLPVPIYETLCIRTSVPIIPIFHLITSATLSAAKPKGQNTHFNVRGHVVGKKGGVKGGSGLEDKDHMAEMLNTLQS